MKRKHITKNRFQDEKEEKRDQKWMTTLTESGVKLSTVTPGPGAYTLNSSSSKKGFSFGQQQNSEVKIRLGFDPNTKY